MMNHRSTFSFLVIFILISTFNAYFIFKTLRHDKISELQETLLAQARLISHSLTISSDKLDRPRIHEIVRKLKRSTEARLTVVNSEGKVLGDSEQTWDALLQMDNYAARPEIRSALQGIMGVHRRYSTFMGMEMLYVAVPLLQNKDIVGALRVALPIGTVEQAVSSIQVPILLSMLVGVLAMILLGLLLGSSTAKRIRRLKYYAKQYMAGHLKEKAPIDVMDELGLLAKAMNQMARRLNRRMREMEEEKNKLAAILVNMAEAVIAVGVDRTILLVNPAAETIFGIEKEEALGKGLIEVVRHKEVDDMLHQAINDQKLVSSDISLSHPRSRELKVNAIGISHQKDGVCALLVASDISDMRRLENMRKEFVANVSHELRTPLTSVKGFIELLQGSAGEDKTKSQSFLNMMEEDTNRLSRLIEDLLELSKIESGDIVLTLEALDLAIVVESVVSMLGKQAKENGIALENNIPAGGQQIVMANRDALSQVLINLIDNAIKFNRSGGKVILNSEIKGDRVEISVQDTGIGISSESTSRIFERFYRVDKARSRELGGTGLGLSIVKHIVEAHRGTITCQSILEEGSTFRFSLHIAKSV